MKPIERKPFIRDLSTGKVPSANPTPLSSQPISLDNQAGFQRPKLGVDLKLQLIALQKLVPSPQQKNLLLETAEVLEEMLVLLEAGDPLPEHLPERARVAPP